MYIYSFRRGSGALSTVSDIFFEKMLK